MSTFLQKLADHPFTEIAGWTLLHFLWQGLLIAAVTAVLLAGLRSATASTRYIVACCGMVLMILAPLITSVWLANGINASPRSLIASGENSNQTLQIIPDGLTKNSSTAPSVEVLTQIAPVHSSTPLPETTAIPVPAQSEATWRETLSRGFPYFVVLWCAGVIALSLRLLGGLWRVRQWRRGGVAIESPELIMLVTRLGKKLGLTRRFDLLESASAAVPAVIGWIKPAVIVPTSLLSGLTTAELESLLAHELAHIRRHDYLVNLLQTVIETLLFYHPAVWWLSGVVRCERENCCDDLAVEMCGNKLDFVRALARMEELRCGEPGLALSARGGSLLGRVERLVAPERLTSSRWPAGVAALISVTVVAIGIGMATMADETPSKSDSPTPASSASEPESDEDFARHQPEVKVVDAVTGQTHEVLSGVKLSQGDTSTRLDMKYSNLMQYTFVPARIAKELGATDLGEIDFGDTPPQKAEQLQQTIRSALLSGRVPQPTIPLPATDKVSPPPAEKNAANEPVYVEDLDGPADGRKIVPCDAGSIWVPDHLAFYGVNQKKQTKFRVVRIDRVSLGIGPRFGPVNALVLDDANTSLGVLGSNWARIPRGPKGESFVHAAPTGFWFLKFPTENKAPADEQQEVVFFLKHVKAESMEKLIRKKLAFSAERPSANDKDQGSKGNGPGAIPKGAPIFKTDTVDKNEQSDINVKADQRVIFIKVGPESTGNGLLKPGDCVDLIGTFSIGNGSTATTVTSTFLKNIEVYSVNETDTREGPREAVGAKQNSIVGVIMNKTQSEKLALVQRVGSLTFLMRGKESRSDTVEEEDPLPSWLDPAQDTAPSSFNMVLEPRTNSLIIFGTKEQIESIENLIIETDVASENRPEKGAVDEKILATHTYDLSRRESSGWIEFDGSSQPVDDGPEAEGVKVYLTLLMDIVAVDKKTGKVLWHLSSGKASPSWKTVSIIDLGPEMPENERLVAEFVSADGKTRRRYDLRTGKEVADSPEKNREELVRPVRRDGDRVTVAEMESPRAGRSPVDLLQRYTVILNRHGRQLENVWVTDQETLVSAEKPSMLPVGPNETMGALDANEIIFNLPEGSGMRAEFAGENVEITPTESGATVVVTNGRIKLYDSNGVVRADASPDGGAEQIVADVQTINNEGVLRLRNRRLKPEPAGAWDPVQVRFSMATGAPIDEGQPPHGAVRFAIENPTENEPARMKIRWHYNLQRIVEDAERMSGKELTESPQNSQIWKLSSKGESTLSLKALEEAIKDRRKSEPSSPPLPQTSNGLTDDSDFVSKCRKLGDWLEFDKNVRFDSRGYMQLASELMALDEPRRIEALRAMANAGLEGQTFALCKMLFEAKAGAEFRRPGLGKPHVVGTMTEMKDWPLEPITLVGDVPLLIVEGYTLAGLREPSIDYLQYCLANCDWTKRSFSEIEKGLAAAEQVIRQPAFWAGSIDQSEWREWATLRLQLRPSLVIEVMQQPWVSIVTPRYSVLDLGSWKVQEIIEKIKTSGHGADVPITLIISDNAKLEWIEPLVKQLAEAGYRNQEHIWWQQSHEPIQKPELQKHLIAISTPIGNLDDGWGPTDAKTGLRLRLTLKEKSISAGKPVLAKLELQNSGDKIAEYDPQIFMPFRVVKVVDGQGKPAMFIGPTPQTFGLQLKLAPGEVAKLWEEVDVSELYLLDSEDYEVSVSLNDRDQNLVMKSGSVGLKINGGQLPQNLQFLKQLREISPAEWDVSTGYGAIYLSHSPTNLKKDVTTIQLWFTEKPLPADYKLGEGDAQQQVTTIAPTELGFLHLAAPTRTTELWPEHIQKITIAAARIFNLNANPDIGKKENSAPDANKKEQTKNLPWRAKGRVTDRDGKPMAGV